jgi:DNA-binding response OmpR family regulator
VLERTLGSAGYDVVGTGDGEDAWQALSTDRVPFDAIILDGSMPRMDGITLLARLKSLAAFRNVPVIMQTGASSPEDIVAGLSAGAFYYLTKPYERTVLLAVVAAAVADHRRYRELLEETAAARLGLPALTAGDFELRTLPQAKGLAVLLANAHPDPERAVVGLTELLANAVEHGNLGITYQEKSDLLERGELHREIERRLLLPELATRRARVTFRREADRVITSIEDAGPGFDWRAYLDYDAARAFDPNGRGIAIARAMSFDELTYHGRGNLVVATVWLG